MEEEKVIENVEVVEEVKAPEAPEVLEEVKEVEVVETVEVVNIPPHIQRVVEEKKALDEKIEKLDIFTTNGNEYYANLSEEEKSLMLRQLYHMNQYSSFLDKRLQLTSLSK